MFRFWTLALTLLLGLGGCSLSSRNDRFDIAASFQFGVGTFRVSDGSTIVAWLSVDEPRTREVWVCDGDWPTGVQSDINLTYQLVASAHYDTPAALRAWIESHPDDSGYDGSPISPIGITHLASSPPFPAPVPGTPVAGAGTFRIRQAENGPVVAWVSIQTDRTERWILRDDWAEVRINATLRYEEAAVDQAFSTFENLLHWIRTAPGTGYDAAHELTIARLHIATAGATE